jgi:hypothetical protein
MKIAGKVIQNRNIRVNNKRGFSAHYKGYLIDVCIYAEFERANPEFTVIVIAPNGSYACNTRVRRCQIRDAIIYALEQSGLTINQ